LHEAQQDTYSQAMKIAFGLEEGGPATSRPHVCFSADTAANLIIFISDQFIGRIAICMESNEHGERIRLSVF
jgi:hypothetical protein